MEDNKRLKRRVNNLQKKLNANQFKLVNQCFKQVWGVDSKTINPKKCFKIEQIWQKQALIYCLYNYTELTQVELAQELKLADKSNVSYCNTNVKQWANDPQMVNQFEKIKQVKNLIDANNQTNRKGFKANSLRPANNIL